MSSNPLRLTGLMSGMDTDSIISSLMKLENMKVDKQFKTATKLNYKVDAYKSVNSKLAAFRLKYATATSGGMLASGTYKAYDVNYTNKSNENGAITVKAGGSNAQAGDYDISVYQLAKAASAESKKFEGTDALSLSDSFEKTVEKLNLDPSSIQVRDVEVKDKDGNVTTEQQKFLQFTVEGADGKSEVVEFNEKDTFGDLINNFNSKETGVVMRFSQISNRVTFESRATGKDTAFKLTDTASTYDDDGNVTGSVDSGFFAALGIGDADIKDGQNSRVVINGEYVEKNTNSLYFEADGMTVNLNKVTSDLQQLEDALAAANPGDRLDIQDDNKVEFTLAQNLDEPIKKITEFVDAYNDLIKELNTLLSEKTYKDYAPLTDEERGALTEKQQEDWDKKAKSGVLRNDSALQGLLSELRGSFYSVVEGTGMSMSSIGLTTSANYMEGGTIDVDETKLRNALSKDPDKVLDMFTKLSYAEDSATKKSESGLVRRIQDAMSRYEKSNKETSLSSVEEQQRKASDKWADMLDKLTDIENNYYLKFAAMESAMAKMQSQLSSLSGFLG